MEQNPEMFMCAELRLLDHLQESMKTTGNLGWNEYVEVETFALTFGLPIKNSYYYSD